MTCSSAYMAFTTFKLVGDVTSLSESSQREVGTLLVKKIRTNLAFQNLVNSFKAV